MEVLRTLTSEQISALTPEVIDGLLAVEKVRTDEMYKAIGKICSTVTYVTIMYFLFYR